MIFRVVFPMHVGVFLGVIGDESKKLRLPHARGGVSNQVSC